MPACCIGGTAERIGGVFDRAEQLSERLHSAPSQPRQVAPETRSAHSASRWTLADIREAFAFLHDYSLAGVSKYVRACGIRLRQGRTQYYSPDPAYPQKEARLLSVLRDVGQQPWRYVALFIDEMSYTRWPNPSSNWCAAAPAARPVADRQHSRYQRYRVVGALDASSGRVCFQQASRISGEVFSRFVRTLAQAYPRAETIDLIWDNWPVHKCELVQQTLAQLPRLRVIALPTYAPWLNPIEKLWRKFRQEVDYLHRFAGEWRQVRQRVAQFFAQFAHGSPELLTYVGLTGNGKLAEAIFSP